MASKFLFLSCMIMVAVISVSPAFASDYVVGDDWGWTLGFDYSAWAMGKQFFVGDTILFKYGVGAHNVYKVNGTAFQQCSVPPPSEALTTGNDKITLATPGRKWYICGVGKHCVNGMKLVITVSPPVSTPSLAPSPSPAPSPMYRAPMMQEKKPMTFWTNWKLKI